MRESLRGLWGAGTIIVLALGLSLHLYFGEDDRAIAGGQYRAPSRYTNYTYEIVRSWPHDPAAYTQGLVYHQGALYESTGLVGASSLRKVELESGAVLKKVDVPPPYFAEGLAIFEGRAFQLTWQHNQGLIYDLSSFQLLDALDYQNEGWGLTQDGRSLIMSDGTDQLRFLDPATYQIQRSVQVLDRGLPVSRINELEFIKGSIYANIWLTDEIIMINPQTGQVTGKIDLGGLLKPADRTPSTDVLNGIAYDAAGDRLFVTGKNWPLLFEIKLIPLRREIRR
jgi:glutamine cyclotransferase